MNPRTIISALACGAALLAAGCGGDDENGNDTSASTQQPAQTSTQAGQPPSDAPSGGGETTAAGIMACLKKAGYVVEDSDTNFTLTSLNEGQKTDDIHALELELPPSARSGASMEIFVFKDRELADSKLEVVKALGSNVEQKGNAILNYGQDYNKDTYKKAPGCIAG